MKKATKLYLGDCTKILDYFIDDNSVDAVVTDPPYGLKFMGKQWDYAIPSVEMWREAFRVLKPGGHLIAFGGTRTYHRLAVAIEDAGFEIRDQVQWIYGQGFPKSLNIALAIDKAETGAGPRGKGFNAAGQGISLNQNKELRSDHPDYVAPEFETDAAKQWEGWGTALKPANEPICLARKPLEKGMTVAQNVLKWGTGALNIDGSRIETNGETPKGSGKGNRNSIYSQVAKSKGNGGNATPTQGRFPANVIFDEAAGELLDLQTQHIHSAGSKRLVGQAKQNQEGGLFGMGQHTGNGMRFGDSGGASRFFYCAKASKSERNAGLEGMPKKSWKEQGFRDNGSTHLSPRAGAGRTGANSNHHPTVKPIKLMEYLCRLITLPGGIVLDPFMGSGTTGVAAKRLGFGFVGIELNEEYFQIAKARIKNGH